MAGDFDESEPTRGELAAEELLVPGEAVTFALCVATGGRLCLTITEEGVLWINPEAGAAEDAAKALYECWQNLMTGKAPSAPAQHDGV